MRANTTHTGTHIQRHAHGNYEHEKRKRNGKINEHLVFVSKSLTLKPVAKHYGNIYACTLFPHGEDVNDDDEKSRQWNIVIANRCQAQLSRCNECETEMSTFCFVTTTMTMTVCRGCDEKVMRNWHKLFFFLSPLLLLSLFLPLLVALSEERISWGHSWLISFIVFTTTTAHTTTHTQREIEICVSFMFIPKCVHPCDNAYLIVGLWQQWSKKEEARAKKKANINEIFARFVIVICNAKLIKSHVLIIIPNVHNAQIPNAPNHINARRRKMTR